MRYLVCTSRSACPVPAYYHVNEVGKLSVPLSRGGEWFFKNLWVLQNFSQFFMGLTVLSFKQFSASPSLKFLQSQFEAFVLVL